MRGVSGRLVPVAVAIRAAMVGQVNAGLFLFYGSLQRRLIIRYLIYKDAGFLYLLGTELTLQRVI